MGRVFLSCVCLLCAAALMLWGGYNPGGGGFMHFIFRGKVNVISPRMHGPSTFSSGCILHSLSQNIPPQTRNQGQGARGARDWANAEYIVVRGAHQ